MVVHQLTQLETKRKFQIIYSKDWKDWKEGKPMDHMEVLSFQQNGQTSCRIWSIDKIQKKKQLNLCESGNSVYVGHLSPNR